MALIVEAGQTSLSTRKMLVETAGFNCISAVTARQSLELAEQHSIDFILYDVDVHDLPARETIAKLRSKFPAAPVYLLTPQGWEPQELRGVSDGVFEKMRDPSEMIQAIERRFPER
ncbi:MAG: response regulator [Terriglobales bacterium]